MKVAIASDDQSTISAHFGRTRGFLIYEVEGQDISKPEFRLNTFTAHKHGEHGPGGGKHKAILEALADCQAVISRGMGQRIYNDLLSADIQPFIVTERSADAAIGKYMAGILRNNPGKGCSHHSHH